MTEILQWYLEIITHEIEKAMNGKLTGNINFQINFKEGGICNMNINLGKSIKLIEKNEI